MTVLTPEQQQAIARARARVQLKQPQDQPLPPSGRHLTYEEGLAALDGEGPYGYGTVLSGIVEGVPIAGPYLLGGVKKAAAGLRSLLYGGSYDDQLGVVNALDQGAKIAHPNVNTTGQVVGAVGGTIPAVVAAPEMFGAAGGSMLMRSGVSALTGGGIGAADTAVRSGGDPEKTGWGALQGTLLGLGGPIAGEAIGAGVKIGAKALTRALLGEEVASKPAQDILAELTRSSRNWLAKNVSDPDMLAAARDRFDELGSDAMFADVLPEWRGVAKSGAARESTRSKVVDPLNERGSMAGARLRSDFETNLGPDPVPSAIDSELDAAREQVENLRPAAVRGQPPYDFTSIANDLDNSIPYLRDDAQGKLVRVRNMLNDFGKDTVASDPAIAFATRDAIDGILASEKNSKVISVLKNARGMIDDALARAVPEVKAIDAQVDELGRQRVGLAQGQSVLVDGPRAMRPAELQEKLVTGAEPQGTLIGPSAESARMRQGTLGDIYRAVGTEASDMNALRKIVRGKGDWNREKLGMMFGPEKADASLNAIDREALFADTANGVTSAADTARQAGFEKYLGEVSKAPEIPTDKSWTDLGLTTARRLARSLLEGNAGAHAARVADEVAPLSVLRGDQRDALMEALVRLGPENIIDQQRMALINALVQGGGGRAVYPLLPGEEHK
ncbi:hypothetical protein [Rhizobium ruizarguesonis]|uniref:hypothetical protein n=1 Tax=Rhizobium ruizarguesonis TaxID=2081791 RepID=UPI0010306E5D|nr:hypothetical protein [Rhizobium ruizarguesonis]TAT82873.1 hypothetical protein ELI52_04960 [Rhizobium ruizarguesonis]TAU30458.1 hypothetical protein ELI47_04870 [Rhizobium ruizarguesonis]TAW20606.1 hypothetical protein ELI20_04985 [Rhizobium ruizarguesonis]